MPLFRRDATPTNVSVGVYECMRGVAYLLSLASERLRVVKHHWMRQYH